MKLYYQQISLVNEKLNEIEFKLKNYQHPCHRQNYLENKHEFQMIINNLHQIDLQLKQSNINMNLSSNCITPLSASSSGYGSDINEI